MKDSYFAKIFIPVWFAIWLFAGSQNFLLTTPDNNSVGQGIFETGSRHSIQLWATVWLSFAKGSSVSGVALHMQQLLAVKRKVKLH